MKRLTDKELLAFLEDLESDSVERRQSFKGDTPTKARQAVCAFAIHPTPTVTGILTLRVILAQRFGARLQIARRKLTKKGNPAPEFNIYTYSVICRVYPTKSVPQQVTHQVTHQVTQQVAPHFSPSSFRQFPVMLFHNAAIGSTLIATGWTMSC